MLESGEPFLLQEKVLAARDPKDAVLQLEISNLVTNLRNAADTAVRAAQQGADNTALLDAVARTQAEYEIACAIVDDAKAKMDTEDNRLKGITPPPQPKEAVSGIRQMLRGMEPFFGYCSHPMDAAYKAQCPIAKQRPPDDAVRQATNEIEDAAPIIRSELERMQAEHKHHQGVADEKKRAMQSAQAFFNAARVRQRMELEELKEPERNAAMIEALHRSFTKGCQDLETLNGKIKDLVVDKETINDTLKALTKLHKDLLAKFTKLFHHIAQHLLDKAVNGRVEFSGKSIEPRLEYNGDRDSAALKVPVHPDLASAFALYLSNFPKSQVPAPDTYLFGSQKGTNQAMGPKSAWRILKSAAKAGGLNADRISTHSLRKTFASEMYEASGHDLRACQVCLGHSDIGSTVKYIEPDAQRLANLIRGLPSRARPAVAAHALGSSPSTQAAAAVGSS